MTTQSKDRELYKAKRSESDVERVALYSVITESFMELSTLNSRIREKDKAIKTLYASVVTVSVIALSAVSYVAYLKL